MNWELVSTLPPGSGSRTLLARLGPRIGVLRQLENEPFYPPKTKEPTLPLLEVAVVAGLRYAVYDVVSAVSLREVAEALLEEERLPPVGFVARAIIDAARAVASIAPPRPHGGLSDASVLVGFDGTVRILDFGAPRSSRFTASGPPSPPNDVFALGAVMHSTLTGFTGHYGEAMAHGLKLPPPSLSNPDVPRALDAVVERATAGRDSLRPSDLNRLADEVEQAMDGALFTSADVTMLVGMALATRREQLALLAREPVPLVAHAPSLAQDRPEDPAEALVPLVLGPDEDTQPLPALGGLLAASSPSRPLSASTPSRGPPPMHDPTASEPSMPSLPARGASSADLPRGSTVRTVLAIVLGAFAIVAVGVHVFAPELIVSMRSRMGASPQRAQAPVIDERRAIDDDLARPARERAPIDTDEPVVKPSRQR